MERVYEIYKHNFKTLATTLKYCAGRGWGLRISSSLMPLSTISLPNLWINWEDKAFSAEIDECARIIKETGIRVSMHPGPYCVLESENQTTVENAVNELNWHGWLLTRLGCPQDRRSPINTHIYTSNGDMYRIMGNFIRNFGKLSAKVKDRLTVENNDKGGLWNCENLLEFNRVAADHIFNVPLCFDNLHDRLLRSSINSQECFERFYDTWEGVTPIFHHSEAVERNSHADYPTFRPLDYSRSVHWDVELKAKNHAIDKLETL